MDLGLKGKKALVLASSKGLGKAVAYELAAEGVEVMLNGRDPDALEDTRTEIARIADRPVHAVKADLLTGDGRRKIVDAVSEYMGHADILVTNAGGPPTGVFESHDEEAWRMAYHLLLESVVVIAKGVIPAMKEQRWGRIITITSQAIKQPVQGLILSNAVRASLLGLVKTLAQELGPYNITINNVMPGFTQTKRLESLMEQNPDFVKAIDDVPLGRVGQPNEFANVVTFLASERASYVTGVSLPVDGGWIKGI